MLEVSLEEEGGPVTNKAKDFTPISVVNFLSSVGHSHKALTLSSYSSAILAVIKLAFPKQWEEDSCRPLLIKLLRRGVSRRSPIVKVEIG